MIDTQHILGAALIDAAGGGHLDVVYYLIQKGVCLDHSNEKGFNAILEAVTNGHLSIVELLVAKKANVSQADKDGVTALMIASSKGRLDMVEYLLKLKVVVDQADCKGETAFMKASANGQLSVAQHLAVEGANVHRINIEGKCAFDMAVENGHPSMVCWLVEQQNKKRETAILEAAKRGHLQITLDLLNTLTYSKRNIDLMWTLFNEASKSGDIDFLTGLEKYYLPTIKDANFTQLGKAIDSAAKNGKLEAINWLMRFCQRNQVDPGTWHQRVLKAAVGGGHLRVVQDFVSNYKPTLKVKYEALCTAADLGHLTIAQFLIEEGAFKGEETIPRALMTAACRGHLAVVELLANLATERLDEKDELGRTSIMYAAWNGHLSVVEHLESLGADVTLTTTKGESALTLAAANGHLPVVEWLMNISTGLDSREAIIEAVENGCWPVVEYFVPKGVDLALEGGTLLLIAASQGHINIVKLLVKCGVDVNCIDDSGNSALTLAASGGWIATVKHLVEHGAEIDHFGAAALIKAAKKGRLDILEYLYDNLSTTSAAEPL